MKQKIAFLLLRISLGVIFLIFGIGKFRGDLWAQTMQGMDFFQNLPWSVGISIVLVGALEVITGAFLILGLLRRWASVIAAIQLTGILWLLNFQEIRDIGLLAIALYLALTCEGAWGIDWAMKHRRRKNAS
jgi:uncharacterized membrane protein YphA (DoxX/SURF4 family)